MAEGIANECNLSAPAFFVRGPIQFEARCNRVQGGFLLIGTRVVMEIGATGALEMPDRTDRAWRRGTSWMLSSR